MVTKFIYTVKGRLSAVNKSQARIDTDSLNYEMDPSRILISIGNVLRFCFSVLLIVFGQLYFFSSSQAGKEKSSPTKEARDETNRKDLRETLDYRRGQRRDYFQHINI